MPEHASPQQRWQAQQDCPHRHTKKRQDIWTRGDDERFELVQASNGRVSFHLRCNHCNYRSSALPYKQVLAWDLNAADIAHVQINPPRQYDPCSVRGCAQTPTEHHHFAPYNTFGDDAWQWPCLPLCRPHHLEWHRRMDGYRWHSKRSAA